jgi:hypothetical protein
MQPIPWRVQLGIVAAAYAAAILATAALLVVRHMQYLNDPANAVGGMFAFGDLLLAVFIAGMFFAATLLLVLVIRKSEPAYTRYSQVMFAISLTAPACFAIMSPALTVLFGWFAMYRLFVSPLLMALLLLSWLLARFPRAKRLLLCALFLEVGSSVTFITVLLVGLSHLRW